MIGRSALVILLCASYATHGATWMQSTALPAVRDLKDGWNQLQPGGETICAKGTPYHFYVRRGSPEKLLVFFEGGGACWTGEDCDRGRPNYHPDLVSPGPAVDPAMRGIVDLAHPENPLADRSAVLLPYCTGDVHLGDRATTYTVPGRGGEPRSFTIQHRGQVNAMTVLRWVYANFAAPREIFVSGSSAGGLATPFYAAVLAQHYPNAGVVALGDDAGMHRGEVIAGANFGRWGHPDVMRRHRGWEKLPEDWGAPNLFVTAARSAPNLRLFQIDHASISRSIHSSSSLGRRTWPQPSNGSRQGCKEASWFDCSARTGRRLARRSIPSDHSLSGVEFTASSRTTGSMHTKRTEYVRVIGWRRSRPASQSRPSIARIAGDRSFGLSTRIFESSNVP